MDTQLTYPSFYDLTNSLLDSGVKYSDTVISSSIGNLPPTTMSATSLEDETRGQNGLEDPIYEPTRVILFKKIPYDCSELEILEICHPFGIVSDIYLMKTKGYCFVQYQELKSAVACLEKFKKTEPKLRGNPVFAFYTGKKEIFKAEGIYRSPSRFILLLINGIDKISDNMVHRILDTYGNVMQINLFDTKPASAYVELEDVGSAILAKEQLNDTNFMNMLPIQIAYINQKIFEQSTANPNKQFLSLPNLTKGGSYEEFSNDFQTYSVENFGDYEKIEKQIDIVQREARSNEKSNNTIMVKGLPKGITCYQLFKLFGMYGNVMKIKIFYSNPENALIEYQDNSQAMLAKAHLNNCCVLGSNIFVTLSRNSIVFNTPYIPENNKYLADYSESKEHRYKIVGSKNFRNIAPPSPVLHLSNLCDDKDEEYYADLFKECGNIKKFLPLKGESRTLLMEMENVTQSVAVLINFHNYNIDGKFLKVSFSKYHMIKE